MKKLIFCFDGTGNEPEDAKQSRGLFGVGDPEDEYLQCVEVAPVAGGRFAGAQCFS